MPSSCITRRRSTSTWTSGPRGGRRGSSRWEASCWPGSTHSATRRSIGLGWLGVGESIDDLLQRWTRLGGRAAIVGPHGSGKSTLLRGVEEELLRRGRLARRFRIDGVLPDLAGLPAGTVVLVDGAETLSFVDWRRLLRVTRGRGLLVTLHRRRSLPVLCRCEPSLELVERLVGQLAGTDASRWLPHARELFERHRGNAHEVFRGLYLLCAGST